MNVDPSLLGHSGFVFKDLNEDCSVDNYEVGLENITLTIQPGNHVVQTNDFGGWYIDSLPVGTYTVLVDTTTTWIPSCLPTTSFTVVDPFVFVETSPIGMKNINPCAEPNVSVIMPVVRPCMPAVLHVLVQNNYTASALIPSAYVDVELDQILTITSASHPYASIGVNQFRFNIGDLYPGQAENIVIHSDADCAALFGQTVCNVAELFPVDPCMLDTIPSTIQPDTLGVFPELCTLPWDGSSLYVDGWCQGDSIFFSVLNTSALGVGDMECFTPILVYVDDTLSFIDSLLLLGGQSQIYTYPATGQTWLMQAFQHPMHPGFSLPNAFVELCGDTSNWSSNIINSYPLDDADPVVDIHCLQVTGSFDPNDKTGYPLGFTTDHFIDPGQSIDYLIRFQNTGTDTAFTVVIRDTLDSQMNIFSVNTGAGSHPYTFALKDQNVLEWTFNNILLPDSTTDESGSQGFISFKVDQIPNLTEGSVIRNDADIYFDFNVPVITNETWHTIHIGTIQVVGITSIAADGVFISAYPNPTKSTLKVIIPESLIGSDYVIIDVTGTRIAEGVMKSAENTVDLQAIPAGYYLIKVGGANVIKVLKQ